MVSPETSDVITVQFSRLLLHYREIGVHRGRTWGFRDVFGFQTLRDLPFVELAGKVKDAYEGRVEVPHEGWPAQREALSWLVDKGREGIYALDPRGIEVRGASVRFALNGDGAEYIETRRIPEHYYVFDGHHRALALFVLGEETILARVNPDPWRPTHRRRDEGASGEPSDARRTRS